MSINQFTSLISKRNGECSSLKSLVLMVVMLVMTASSTFAQASFETIDGIRYLIDSDAKTAAVVPLSGDQKYSGDVVVPEKVKAQDGVEYPVTAFGDNAFKQCYNLTSISIPSAVTSLGESCFFGCSILTSVNIPSAVTSLGSYCFSWCSNLKSITITSSVTSLGNYCFEGCAKLTSINIPSSVTSLGDGCFSDCFKLTRISIPSSVTSLGMHCFYNCAVLTRITIPSSVTSLGIDCFYNCAALTSITIPSSVKEIGSDCFRSCSNLKSTTFNGKCPKNTINSNLITTCILYVPKAYLQAYKDALGSKYQYIYASKDDGTGEDNPTQTCATPTIIYADGKLRFESAREGAQYHYTITDADMATDAYSEDGKVQLTAVYNISAYATADGYQASEKATATLYWVKANGNLENGASTNINQAKTRGIVATSHDGIVTLSGLDNGEEVRFYAADGKQMGSVRAIGGVASQAVSTANRLVFAKIGSQAIKIAVK